MKTEPITATAQITITFPSGDQMIFTKEEAMQLCREIFKAFNIHPQSFFDSSRIGQTLADAAYRIIKDANEAMPRARIQELLKIAGVEIDLEPLSQALSRDDRFIGIGKGRGAKWTLKEFLMPPVPIVIPAPAPAPEDNRWQWPYSPTVTCGGHQP